MHGNLALMYRHLLFDSYQVQDRLLVRMTDMITDAIPTAKWMPQSNKLQGRIQGEGHICLLVAELGREIIFRAIIARAS